jgi:hypothetical protein
MFVYSRMIDNNVCQYYHNSVKRSAIYFFGDNWQMRLLDKNRVIETIEECSHDSMHANIETMKRWIILGEISR